MEALYYSFETRFSRGDGPTTVTARTHNGNSRRSSPVLAIPSFRASACDETLSSGMVALNRWTPG
jgi:hypothetical protein